MPRAGSQRGRFPLRGAQHVPRVPRARARRRAWSLTRTAPVNTVAPIIIGTPEIGDTLICSNGTWTGQPEPSFTKQWYRSIDGTADAHLTYPGGEGTAYEAIAGATDNIYDPVEADRGEYIFCVATATNSEGSASEPSADTGPVFGDQAIPVAQAAETGAALAISAYRPTALSAASETDAAQVVTHAKQRAAGLNTETDAALAATARKTKAAGEPSETDSALAATSRKTKAIGQASETDTGQQLRGNINRLIGQASEADTAQPVAGANVYRTGSGRVIPVGSRGRHRGRYPLRGAAWEPTALSSRNWAGSEHGTAAAAQTITVGQAVETDAAFNLILAAKVIAVGQATETSTAQRVLRERRYRSGFPYPVDTVHAGPFVVPTLVTDPQTAQPVTRVKTKTLGQASETDVTFAAGAIGAKVLAVGIAVETDTAQAARRVKSRTPGLNTETDTALTAAHRKTRAPGQVTETETALTIRPARIKPLGQAVETDSALAARRVRSRTLGIAPEFEVSQAHARRKRREPGLVTETESARPITITGRDIVVLELPASLESAQPVARRKHTTVGLPQGNETAHPILEAKARAVALVTEADAALAVRAVKARTLSQAAETESAGRFVRLIGVAVEGETALSITRAGARLTYRARVKPGHAATARSGHATRPKTGAIT